MTEKTKKLQRYEDLGTRAERLHCCKTCGYIQEQAWSDLTLSLAVWLLLRRAVTASILLSSLIVVLILNQMSLCVHIQAAVDGSQGNPKKIRQPCTAV